MKLIAWYNGDAVNSALPERDPSVKYLKTYEIKDIENEHIKYISLELPVHS